MSRQNQGNALRDDVEDVPPRADAMMESLRAVGYTLGAAVADLVDNSITATATQVDIHFRWDGSESAILVLDNGLGMDEAALREAMRAGTRNPRERRERRDLGRFGLGLKTASFSQCRLLTVVARSAGKETYARHWDLDLLEREREWLLCKGLPAQAQRFMRDFAERKQGTMVVLQKLDRLVPQSADSSNETRDAFLAHGQAVKQHLSMVFHRFLKPPNNLAIRVNGTPIKAWDPFLQDHDKTQWLEKEAHELFGDQVRVRPFVLPHHSNLTAEQHSAAAGAKGWNAMQGFYVYRAKRLLVAGDYLGLKYLQEPHYSLARIQIDIPNTMDAEWQIDVKKATAVPPLALRSKLDKIARLTRMRASEVYRHRGKVIRRKHAEQDELVWQLKSRNGKKYFSINRDHPVIQQALSAGGEASRHIKNVLAVVERSVPLESMIYQYQEAPEEFLSAGQQADDKEIVTQGLQLYRLFRGAGMAPKRAREKLVLIEPFGDSAALQAKLDEIEEETD